MIGSSLPLSYLIKKVIGNSPVVARVSEQLRTIREGDCCPVTEARVPRKDLVSVTDALRKGSWESQAFV